MDEEAHSLAWDQGPPQTLEERLTEQFYAWERRGRGWQIWDYPVELEPPFRPFVFHYLPPNPTYDDARKPTFLSSLVDMIRGRPSLPSSSQASIDSFDESESEEPEPEPIADSNSLIEIEIALPPDTKITREATEQFLASLTYCSRPVSFEVIGLPGSITVQVACGEADRPQIRQQLKAHFPEAVATVQDCLLAKRWEEIRGGETVIVDFGLSHEFMLPLKTLKSFEPDPLIGVTGALSALSEGEVGVLQILFQAVRSPWSESILRAVTDCDGRAFFADAPEIVPLAKQKVSRPLFATVVRVAAKSRTYGRGWQLVKSLGGALTQFSSPASNELIPLENQGYDDSDHEQDLLCRQTRRSGMILNGEELVSLVHLPSASVRVEELKRETKKTKAAPSSVIGHRLVIGENRHGESTTVVTLNAEQRVRHTYVIGASGTGKSTLLLNMIIQDIRNGEGIGVLDPHGDLIDEVLGYIPEERHSDVVLLDPSDEEYPVGFNILSAHSEIEKNLLASDLVSVFRRLSTSWGDQMTSVLGNAILAFLESDRGGTLAELRRFLVEGEFRRSFLPNVRDPEIVYYWEKEFPLLAGKPQAPILTRLDTFLRPKLIRHMVSQKESKIDFAAVMNTGKIFLAKLAQGAIGEENSYLLGTLLVSKLHQMAMGRQQLSASERRNFYLYIDEFHNFMTPSMAAILSGARKYHLGLILAHQDLQQLRDSEVLSAVIQNPNTRVCFRLGDFDARKLEEGFSFFQAKDLQNLSIGEAIARVERSEYDFNLKTLPLPEVEVAIAKERRDRIVSLSRERYAVRREVVEKALAEQRPAASASRPAPEPTRERKREPSLPIAARPAQTPTKEQEVTLSPETTLPGRGGQQHKYLQQLIKRWAEGKGYRANIEKQILDGMGSVDVALERGDQSIACEISVTSTVDYEIGNIQKCLAAGFAHVALVSTDKKTLAKVRDLATGTLSAEDAARVRFVSPEELFSFIDELDAQAASKEQTVRGYKVKVKYKAVDESEKKTRRQAVSRVILDALKRLKGSEK